MFSVRRALILAVLTGALSLGITTLFVNPTHIDSYAEIRWFVVLLTTGLVVLAVIVGNLLDREAVATVSVLKDHLSQVQSERQQLEIVVAHLPRAVDEALTRAKVQESLTTQLAAKFANEVVTQSLLKASQRVGEEIEVEFINSMETLVSSVEHLEKDLQQLTIQTRSVFPLLEEIIKVKDSAARGELLVLWWSALKNPKRWRKVRTQLRAHGLLLEE